MEIKKLHEKAIFYINLKDKLQKYIFQLKRKIWIEDNKPYHKSYLLTPRNFYIKEIDRCEKIINFIDKRINIIYEKIKNN